MRTVSLFFLLCSLFFVTTACKEFLEPQSPSEFVPKDANALNEMLLGEAYPRATIGGINTFMGLLDDDVAAAPYQEPNSTIDANRYFAPFTWQSDVYVRMEAAGIQETNTNMYAQYYRFIKGCNAALDYVGDMSDTEENKNNVRAQAHALRAFFNLQLVNMYAMPYNHNPQGLGIPIKRTSMIESTDIKRNTIAEVYEFILEDLLEAERLYLSLPDDRQWATDFRTNLPMVQLLLSRAYLYMENWAKASEYAAKVMANSHLRLLDLNTVPTIGDAQGVTDARIFMNYHSFDSSPETIWLYGKVTDMTMLLSDNSVDADGRAIHTFFRASDALLRSFDAKDLRRDRYVTVSWFKTQTEGGALDYMPQAFGKVNVVNSLTSAYDIHVQFWASDGTNTTFGRSLRLSEAYLNFIEAETQLATTEGGAHQTNALSRLNELRAKRFAPADFTPVTITDKAQLLQFVKDERRRELCFEGHRWNDLRRWGMPEIKHVWYESATREREYTLRQADPFYALPIPNQALDLNPSLEPNPLAVRE